MVAPRKHAHHRGLRARATVGALILCLLVSPLTACSTNASQVTAVVRGYLAALARGDAAAALAYGRTDGSYCPLASDALLAASLAEAPLTVDAIDRPEILHDAMQGSDTAMVAARYHLGDQAVSVTFSLTRYPSGWQMDTTVASVSFPSEGNRWLDDIGGSDSVGLTLNGVPFAGRPGSMCLFPGVYQFAATNPLVSLTGGRFTLPSVVARLTVYDGQPAGVSVSLTDTARKQLGVLAQAALDPCLTEHSLHTSCGVSEGYWRFEDDVVESTVVWSVEPAGLDMSKWDWRLYRGGVIPTGPAYQADRAAYDLHLRGTAPNGKPFSMNFSLPAVCANIADPGNVRIDFSDSCP